MEKNKQFEAFGAPGIEPRWTSSAKSAVGTALNHNSHVWFTLSHGILNEIYYPHIDQACTRDMGLIITDGIDFFSEEKRATNSEIHWLAEGVPAFRVINTCYKNNYLIEKEILTDPHRNTVLQNIRFTAQKKTLSDYHLYALLAPHLENAGSKNTAWLDEFDGMYVLFAQHKDCALALLCSHPYLKRSVGYVGSSDGWRDLKQHKQMTWEYKLAQNGNVALTAEIDLIKSQGNFVLSLGFGKDPAEAAKNAIGSLKNGFDKAKYAYISEWQNWKKKHGALLNNFPSKENLDSISLAVIRTHESKTAPGGLIASLSIPWGFSKGDNDLGGYHLVWTRDMVEAGGAFLAVGAHEDVRRMLEYLKKTQLPNGHWPQNMWLDGSSYWSGIQMDETSLPILLVDLAYREKALTDSDLVKFWPMVKRAAVYLVLKGPVSQEDRWEEDQGYTPFTLGAEIASLLVAADIADLNEETSNAAYFREIADFWNTTIEHWMYVKDTDWSQKFDVEGYYIRIAPFKNCSENLSQRDVNIKNVVAKKDTRLARHLVSPDILALVRFGLRAADDPYILNTVKIIDDILKVETPTGPTWHRYNDDGYGEHKDGSPFNGTGIGRGWPLLTGERAHYELAAGRIANAERLLATLKSFANEGGLLSEQVWDSPDIPERELFFGRPSGSAMPLVWAHAEYLKLRRSLIDGKVFDMPPQTVKRYQIDKTVSPLAVWRFNHQIHSMLVGKILRIETLTPAIIHWSADNWNTIQEDMTHETGLGIHFADLHTQGISEKKEIKFTFFWPDSSHWEGKDFIINTEDLNKFMV